MKIGIFGGSFNPPHNMHKNIGLNLIKKGYVDKVIYVPTGNFYKKDGLIDFKYRLEMLKLMLKETTNLLISDIGNEAKYEYTYQILDYFKKLYGEDEIYFICGSDNLDTFNTWKNFEDILSYYKLLVIKRNNDDIDKMTNRFKMFIKSIIWADIDFSDISSTGIRKLINDNKFTSLQDRLDDNVIKYIIDNELYKSDDFMKERYFYGKGS